GTAGPTASGPARGTTTGTAGPQASTPAGSGPATAPPSGDTTATSDSAAPVPGGSVTAKPLRGKRIVIDPGHNENNYRHVSQINRQVDVLTKRKACDTTGTSTNDGYSEAAFTWDVSQKLKAILEARGAQVKLTRNRNTPYGPCITERARTGKGWADAAVSVHADGAGTASRGFHVIIPKKIGGPVDPVVAGSEKLGLAVRKAFRSGTGLPYSNYIGRDALSYRDDLGGLNLSTVPKVFIECGNMRNATDARLFKDPSFRKKIALSLANGLQDHLT
ncbi:N-acetylmuramoyl-L-alanine amidase, partial [Planomonospora corallina]